MREVAGGDGSAETLGGEKGSSKGEETGEAVWAETDAEVPVTERWNADVSPGPANSSSSWSRRRLSELCASRGGEANTMDEHSEDTGEAYAGASPSASPIPLSRSAHSSKSSTSKSPPGPWLYARSCVRSAWARRPRIGWLRYRASARRRALELRRVRPQRAFCCWWH